MTNTASALLPAIEALEKDLAELERQGNALLVSINVLREKAGLPPRPGGFAGVSADVPASAAGVGTPLALRSDSFVGKRMGAAAREYLEMRKASGGDAPATVREIFEALKEGGYDFKSKDDANAIIVLRAMLRKSSAMFYKLQNGKYGLRSWYGPNIKTPKDSSNSKADDAQQASKGDQDEDDLETEGAKGEKSTAAA